MATLENTQLSMIKGDSRVLNLHFSDSNGADINITGWTIFLTIKKVATDTDEKALVKKDVTVHTNPSLGQTQITLAPTDTSAIPAGKYPFDIQAKTDTDEIVTVVKGTYTIEQDITRRSIV